MRDPYLPFRPKPSHQFDQYGQPADAIELFFYDDFVGDEISQVWSTLGVGNSTQEIMQDESAVELALTTASTGQKGVLDWGGGLMLDLTNALIFETRLKFSVLPQSGVEAGWGVASGGFTDPDLVQRSAWFLMVSDSSIRIENDDGLNETNQVDTFKNMDTVYHTYTIDFTKQDDLQFFIDGERHLPLTTFDMSNLSGSGATIQPYFHVTKSSGTGPCTMVIDYVKAWHSRLR